MFGCINSYSFITNTNGTIISFLQKQDNFLGYDQSALIGRNIIQYIPPSEQNDLIEQLNSIKKIPFVIFECNILGKDGSLNNVNMMIYKFELNNEIYLSICITGNCEERSISQIMNDINNNTMEDLILGIMHEINNPNNFLMLNIPYLHQVVDNLMPIAQEYSQSHPGHKILGLEHDFLKQDIDGLMVDVYEGINRIKKITSSLTELLGAKTCHEELNLLTLTDDIIKSHSKALSSKNISININNGNFDYIGVNCDKKNFHKAISNILLNAIESFDKSVNESKKISVSFNLSLRSKSLSIIIEDNGVGIPETNLFKVFNPFFTTRRDKSQLGLGLYLCRYIIDSHGGNINIESEEGEGTKVCIRLSYIKVKKNIKSLITN